MQCRACVHLTVQPVQDDDDSQSEANEEDDDDNTQPETHEERERAGQHCHPKKKIFSTKKSSAMGDMNQLMDLAKQGLQCMLATSQSQPPQNTEPPSSSARNHENPTTATATLESKLARLTEMHNRDQISDEEFASLRAKCLAKAFDL